MDSLVAEFGQTLRADGKRETTIDSYLGDVRAFLAYLSEKDVHFDGDLKRFYVTSYKRILEESGFQVATINKKINSLASFNHFLIEKGLTDAMAVNQRKDKVKVASGSEGEVSVYTDAEVDRILFYIQDTSRVSPRDRVMVMILMYTGVRVSELVSLKMKDLDFLTMQVSVCGKGGKHREVPLKPEVVEAIREYLEERKLNPHRESPFLLLTQRSPRMNRDTVNQVLYRMGEVLGIHMFPHKFRHSFCDRLVKKGVPLTVTATVAGHASIQTTARFYVNTNREDKQRAVALL